MGTCGYALKRLESRGNPRKRVKTRGDVCVWKSVVMCGNARRRVETGENTWKRVETFGNEWKRVETRGDPNLLAHQIAFSQSEKPASPKADELTNCLAYFLTGRLKN